IGRNKKRLSHIKFLVNQAREESKGYYHPEVGFNYRMTNIEAAMGLAQLSQLDEFLKTKKTFNVIYKRELKNIPSVRLQKEYAGAKSSYWMNCVCLEECSDIPKLQAGLLRKNIPTRRVFQPANDFPPYKRCKSFSLDNSREIFNRSLCLPSSVLNSEKGIRYVCDTLKDLL
ncbi:MAG: DegT/DnrJ/EryC1/StrS family aminotransferase, partial [Candidatus Margulisiibacteriota bacterium]